MRRTFKLYPAERHWWSFNDYGAVLDVMEQLRPKTVLEFGPGSSTLALIEGGAEHIDACEDDADWFKVHQEGLTGQFPHIVTIRFYTWSDPLIIPVLDGTTYDMALIDGPRTTTKRPTALAYALARCSAVLMPTEDYRNTPYLRPILESQARTHNLKLEIRETGPLAGHFALLTR